MYEVTATGKVWSAVEYIWSEEEEAWWGYEVGCTVRSIVRCCSQCLWIQPPNWHHLLAQRLIVKSHSLEWVQHHEKDADMSQRPCWHLLTIRTGSNFVR